MKSAPPVLLTLLPSPTTHLPNLQLALNIDGSLSYRKYNCPQPENTTAYIQKIQQLTSRKWNCPSITTAPKQEMGLLLYRKYRWQPLIREIQLTNRIYNFSYEMQLGIQGIKMTCSHPGYIRETKWQNVYKTIPTIHETNLCYFHEIIHEPFSLQQWFSAYS